MLLVFPGAPAWLAEANLLSVKESPVIVAQFEMLSSIKSQTVEIRDVQVVEGHPRMLTIEPLIEQR